MKFYLAARYARRDELRECANDLCRIGHEITSRWIYTDYPLVTAGDSAQAPPEERERIAVEDDADVRAADCFLAFTEVPNSTDSRGGRHVEFGLALGLQKSLMIIGPRENLFHHAPTVFAAENWKEAFRQISLFFAGL